MKWSGLLIFAGAACALASFGSTVPAAHAVAEPTGTARAKAVIRDATGAVKGTVYLTEYLGSGLLDQRIDVAGTVNGLAPGAHGLHLRSGDCASPGQHVDFSGASDPLSTHPRDEGDLPNVVADGAGRASIRLTKVSNRFTLSSNPDLNVWAASGGPVIVAIDANATTSTTFDAAPVLCGVLVCDAGPCDSTIGPAPGPSLVHHYVFDGNANDSVGTDHGTLEGGAIAAGGLLTLNGTTAYVQFLNKIVPTSGSYTVALFAQEAAPDPEYVEFISQGFSSGPGFYVGHEPGGGTIRVSDAWISTGEPFPSDGQQHHYALVMDAGPANQARLYIDGVLQQTTTAFTTTNGGDATRFGSQFGALSEFFNGTLADVRIYPTALTGAQIAALVPSASTTAVWTGGGTTDNWSDAGNWSTGQVPNATNRVRFDGALSNDPCVIDAPATVVGIQSVNAYSGTITQAPGRTVTVGTDGVALPTGTFAGTGAAEIRIAGSLSLSGGTFSSNATLRVGGNMSGGFNALSGSTVILDGTAPQTIAVDRFVDVVVANTAGVVRFTAALLDVRGLSANATTRDIRIQFAETGTVRIRPIAGVASLQLGASAPHTVFLSDATDNALQWNVDVDAATSVLLNRVDVKDSNATGTGAPVSATNSIGDSDTTGWSFN